MTQDPYPLHDHTHPHAHDLPEDSQVFDLMWRTGQSLYDILIWMRDHAATTQEVHLHHQEAHAVARDMENAAVNDRDTQWRAYAGFARRRDEALHLIDTSSPGRATIHKQARARSATSR